jgi:hypothetical protein
MNLNSIIGEPGSTQRSDTNSTLGAVSAGMALGGPLGGLYAWGKAKAGNEMTKASDNINKQLTDLNQWYNSEYYKDYMDSTEARSMMSTLQTQMKTIMAGVDNQGAAMGGTGEQRIAAKGETQRNLGDAINRLAGMGAQKKQGVRRDYMTYGGIINGKLNDIFSQKAAGYNQISDNVATGATDLLSLAFGGGTGALGGLIK